MEQQRTPWSGTQNLPCTHPQPQHTLSVRHSSRPTLQEPRYRRWARGSSSVHGTVHVMGRVLRGILGGGDGAAHLAARRNIPSLGAPLAHRLGMFHSSLRSSPTRCTPKCSVTQTFALLL